MLSLCVCEVIVCVVGGGGRTEKEEEEARDTESKTRTPHKVVGNKEEFGEGGGVIWNQCGLRVFWGGEMRRAW